MIVFSYPKDTQSADRKKVLNHQAIGAYAMQAAALIEGGVDVQPMPTHGVMPHGGGAWAGILFPLTECKRFASQVKSVSVECEDDSMVELDVSYRKIMDPEDLASTATPLTLPKSFLDDSYVCVCVRMHICAPCTPQRNDM